ncbi:unnamed protein product [Enterobius vermicularis]|uniref:Neuroguidin n=1 Tax=Enterobius vermicularis TaxID=51028 RepID=A0A0N4USI0_ENTVE|nr:unnamed protein product [Enterobius vermicularis]
MLGGTDTFGLEMLDASQENSLADLQQQLSSLVEKCYKVATEVNLAGKQLLAELAVEKDRNGISLLEIKNRDLLAYTRELAFLMSQMSSGESIQGSPAIERSVYLRTVLERIRPIGQKMKTQVEKLVHAAYSSKKQNIQELQPHPEMMNFEQEKSEDLGENRDVDGPQEQANKKYVPPKLVAVHYNGTKDDEAKNERKLERKRKRALQSSLIQDLRAEYSEAPEEITDDRTVKRFQQADKEKQKHEEDYFIRLQVNKRERHKRKLKSRQNIIEELLQFGDYMAMDKEDEELSRKKLFRSRKGSRKERGLKSQGGKVRKKVLDKRIYRTLFNRAKLERGGSEA